MLNLSAERKRILEEIEQIPENKLKEVYRLVHNYRIEQEETESDTEPFTKSVMQYAGAWKDMPDEEFNEFLEEIRTRRRKAFSSRRDR